MAASLSIHWYSRLSEIPIQTSLDVRPDAPRPRKRKGQGALVRIDRISDTLLLDAQASSIKGVTASRMAVLEKLGIHTVRDLICHYPRRHLDLTEVHGIADAQIGHMQTIYATIYEVKLKRPRPRLPIVEVTLIDETGTLIVSFFHMPWLAKRLKPGTKLAVSGKVTFDYGFKRMANPFFEEADGINAEGRILPIHPASEKLQAGQIRRLIFNALDQTRGLIDPLPASLRAHRNLVSRGAAWEGMHRPRSMQEVKAARRRLVYEELLLLQLFLMRQDNERARGENATSHLTDGPVMARLRDAIPFSLTDDQDEAICDLLSQMKKDDPADHMILGDVGTGKTVVAAFGVAAAVDTGGQAMLMAPTEILAQQHERTLGALFDKAGISHALLTGSTSSADRSRTLGAFARGEIDVLIGTHALIEDDVIPHHLTFVIIDEQQRFGVNQRARLLEKAPVPDALYMTATPIPRSLALTLFGNLTHSYLRHKPHASSTRITRAFSQEKRGYAYDAAKDALARGEQVYVVCPLVGASKSPSSQKGLGEQDEPYHPDVLIENADDMETMEGASAVKQAKKLSQTVFVDHEVGLLHGGLSAQEKEQVMEDFKSGKIQVLVTTTVIEVGVDVPNATVMIVENADRFGLSQLHQLRGRVGRGEKNAEVYLISSATQPMALARLQALVESDDGFQIAAYDLSLRREGDILGNRQSGTSSLKLVNIIEDADLIEMAHEDALALLKTDPDLEMPEHASLAREVRQIFKRESQVSGG